MERLAAFVCMKPESVRMKGIFARKQRKRERTYSFEMRCSLARLCHALRKVFVRLDQLENADAATLTSANTYTDQKVATLNLDFTNYRAEVDDRFEQQDSRINKVGAMGAAMANMTASAAGVGAKNRMAIGVGNYRGENALSFGYQRALSDKAVITFGGAFKATTPSVGAGAALGW